MIRNSIINLTLKVGLSIPVLFAGLAAIVVPDRVLSYWPSFIVSRFSDSLLTGITGLGAFGMIVWILSGRRKFAASATITVLLALAGISNMTRFSFLVDLAPLFFIGCALTLRYYPRIRVIHRTKVTPLVHLTPIDEDGEHVAEIEDEDDYDDYKDDELDDSADNSGQSDSESSGSATIVVESEIHTEHDQHIFVPKQ